jgi:hypothetical protein
MTPHHQSIWTGVWHCQDMRYGINISATLQLKAIRHHCPVILFKSTIATIRQILRLLSLLPPPSSMGDGTSAILYPISEIHNFHGKCHD